MLHGFLKNCNHKIFFLCLCRLKLLLLLDQVDSGVYDYVHPTILDSHTPSLECVSLCSNCSLKFLFMTVALISTNSKQISKNLCVSERRPLLRKIPQLEFEMSTRLLRGGEWVRKGEEVGVGWVGDSLCLLFLRLVLYQ